MWKGHVVGRMMLRGGGRHVQGRREAFLISVVFAAVWEVGEMRGYADKKTQG